MLNNSRQSSLMMSRDRLARSMERFERLANDAIERLEFLNEEKRELEKKLRDMQRQTEEDRANAKHNERLYESLQEDLKSQQSEIDSLQRKREDQETLIREQLQTIERLERELSEQSSKLADKDLAGSQQMNETQELRAYIDTLEDRLTKTSQERDELREQIYAREREESQWAVKLTADDQRKAEAELDQLLGRIDEIERQLSTEGVHTNGVAAKQGA
jgi:chromosome segregation ATPase